MTRNEFLATAYDAVGIEIDRALIAYESRDMAGFDAAMRRVMIAMDEVGEMLVDTLSDPTAPIRLH